MTRLGKRLVVIAAVVVSVPLTLYVALWLFFAANEKPSNVVDFRPEFFQAKADSEFFYSIGDELKFSDQIDPKAATLLRAHIENFLVSPDNRKIAVVANGKLVVVGSDSFVHELTPVDSIYKEPKPIGRQFFRDEDFQWSRDSKVLYLIRDEYYQSKGSQLFSARGELWKYDLDSNSLQPVLKPFQAYSYFLGLKSGIYFSVPTAHGDLQLRYFDGNHVSDVDAPNAESIDLNTRTRDFVEAPFYSFSIIDYQTAVRSWKDVDLVVDGNVGPQKLVIRGKPYLALTLGNGFKGPYYCSELLRSVFLPGDRYFLFNVPNCGNYNGQLLIDTVSAEYERLPADSVVYLTLNTETYSGYRVTGAGIVSKAVPRTSHVARTPN